MSNQTKKIISADEKMLWQGQPNCFVYMVSNLYRPVFIVISSILLWRFYMPADIRITDIISFSLPNLILLILLFGSFFFRFIYKLFLYPYIWYVITDKRIIFQSGLIGRDFDYVDYDKVENANVSVGIIDKLLRKNTGTIFIFSNRMETDYVEQGNKSISMLKNAPFTLESITDPYEVFSKFKKVSFDIKADVNYPNALRPHNNPGYKTDYDPKK